MLSPSMRGLKFLNFCTSSREPESGIVSSNMPGPNLTLHRKRYHLWTLHRQTMTELRRLRRILDLHVTRSMQLPRNINCAFCESPHVPRARNEITCPCARSFFGKDVRNGFLTQPKGLAEDGPPILALHILADLVLVCGPCFP